MPPLPPPPAADGKSEHRDCNEPHSLAANNGRRNAGFSISCIQRCNEAVPSARQRLDVARLIGGVVQRSEEHTSELQSQSNLVCRLLLEKKKTNSTRGGATAKSG